MIEKGEKGDRGPSSLIPWILLTLAFVVVAIVLTRDYTKSSNSANQANKISKQNKVVIKELKVTKASVDQLRKTNCTLRLFLATARVARYQTQLHETGPKKLIDKNAVDAYTKLIVALDGRSYCPLPNKLQLPFAGVN